jgi:hypothetical protein
MLCVGKLLNKVYDVDEHHVLLISNRRGPERGYIRKGHAHGQSCPSHQNLVPETLVGVPGMACQCAVMAMFPYDSQ